MNRKIIFLALLVLILGAQNASAEKVCGIYFTKIGCPNCNVTDPLVLDEWPGKHNDLVLIEYVFTSWYEENAVLMGEYNLSHGTGSGVPIIILSEEKFYTGRLGVLEAESEIEAMQENKCLLMEGKATFEELNLNNLPANPKLWANNRLLAKKEGGIVSSDFLKETLFSENLRETLAESSYQMQEIKAEPAPMSGGSILFEQAVLIEDSWVLKLKHKIELPENVQPLDSNKSNGNENGGSNPNEANPLFIPVAIIIISLLAIIIFFKVKSK